MAGKEIDTETVIVPHQSNTGGGIAIGRKSWLFAGCGGKRAASVYTLIATTKLNKIDPQAWLA
jgi:hypothetical protein